MKSMVLDVKYVYCIVIMDKETLNRKIKQTFQPLREKPCTV